MLPPAKISSLENLHPSLWRGSRLGRTTQRCIDTGHVDLSAALPGGGWPLGTLTELLTSAPGIGELRLLQPALQGLASHRRIVLLQPPYSPHAACWASWRLPLEQLLWIKPGNAGDALWAAEQILKNGSCAALLYWQSHVRSASLRRLHLAAQASDSLFLLFRHDQAVGESSPAPLRLHLQPSSHGLRVDVVKRRGPSHDRPIFLNFSSVTAQATHALVDQRAPDATQPRRPVPAAPVFAD